MKLKTLYNAYPALTKLAGQDLPLPELYRLSRILRAFEEDIRFFMEQRNEFFRKYGAEQDGELVLLPEHAEEFAAAMDELGEIDADADAESLGLPMKLDADVMENVRLSYNDLQMLEEIVELKGGLTSSS